jgi:bifunctional DNA-binding transcriptional regulator/antitoxin component of YhaV-PrlF toxin-antitoxin module
MIYLKQILQKVRYDDLISLGREVLLESLKLGVEVLENNSNGRTNFDNGNNPNSSDNPTMGSPNGSLEDIADETNPLESFDGEEKSNQPQWILINETRAITGFEPTSLYGSKAFETYGGPVKTKKEGRNVLVEVNSLEEYVTKTYGKFEMLTIPEAANLWEEKAEKRLGYEVGDKESYLYKNIRDGLVVTTKQKKYGKKQMVVSEKELYRVIIPYIAKKVINGNKGSAINFEETADILNVGLSRVKQMVNEDKLKISRNKEGISIRSLKMFLNEHVYSGGRWYLAIK